MIRLVAFSLILLSSKLCFSQTRVAESDLNLQTKYLEARKLLELGKIDNAIVSLEALYKDHRSNATISYELAKAYALKKDFSSVEKYGENAIKNAPNNEWMLSFYADYMLMNNRPETANKLYDVLIALQPKKLIYYDKKVDALIKLNQSDLALATYDALLLAVGPNADAYLNKFDIYDNLGKKEEALIQLDLLTKLAPFEKKYLKLKAGFLQKHKESEKVKEIYKQVLSLDPNDIDANVYMIGENKKNDQSEPYLRSLIPIIVDPKVPLDAKIKELLPYVNNLATKKDTLLKSALQEVGSKLVLSYPNDAKAHALFGDILISSGNLKEGILQFEKTIALDDKKYLIWSQLLYALYEDNDFTKLKKYSNQAIDLFPNEAESFFFASMADIHFNKPNSSFSLAEEAIMISGSNKDKSALSFTAKAASHLALGEIDKAASEITKALEYSDNKNAFAFEVQGDIFFKNKNYSGAKQAYASSLKLGNHSKRLEKKINEQAN